MTSVGYLMVKPSSKNIVLPPDVMFDILDPLAFKDIAYALEVFLALQICVFMFQDAHSVNE